MNRALRLTTYDGVVTVCLFLYDVFLLEAPLSHPPQHHDGGPIPAFRAQYIILL